MKKALIVILVLTLTLGFVFSCGSKLSGLDKWQDAYEQGNYAKARGGLEAMLVDDENNHSARRMLVLVEIADSQHLAALGHLTILTRAGEAEQLQAEFLKAFKEAGAPNLDACLEAMIAAASVEPNWSWPLAMQIWLMMQKNIANETTAERIHILETAAQLTRLHDTTEHKTLLGLLWHYKSSDEAFLLMPIANSLGQDRVQELWDHLLLISAETLTNLLEVHPDNPILTMVAAARRHRNTAEAWNRMRELEARGITPEMPQLWSKEKNDLLMELSQKKDFRLTKPDIAGIDSFTMFSNIREWLSQFTNRTDLAKAALALLADDPLVGSLATALQEVMDDSAPSPEEVFRHSVNSPYELNTLALSPDGRWLLLNIMTENHYEDEFELTSILVNLSNKEYQRIEKPWPAHPYHSSHWKPDSSAAWVGQCLIYTEGEVQPFDYEYYEILGWLDTSHLAITEVAEGGKSYNVVKLNAETGERTLLHNSVSQASLSAEGDLVVAFAESNSLRLVRANGEAHELPGKLHLLDVLPDGSGASGYYEEQWIFGQWLYRFTEQELSPYYYVSPCWESPLGNNLFYARIELGRTHLLKMNIDSMQYTLTGIKDFGLWDATGNLVAVGHHNNQVVVYKLK